MKYFLPLLLLVSGCSKKQVPSATNYSPLASITAAIVTYDPLSVKFTVTASDADNDPLSYNWDFGNGIKKTGSNVEQSTFTEGKIYSIVVKVSDGKSNPATATIQFDATTEKISINTTRQFQSITGFGGFGAKDVYWSNGPFTSPEFVNDLVNDLGLTILRDELPVNFEPENDNNDPFVTDLTKYGKQGGNSTQSFAVRVPYFKALAAAGVKTFIASVWSPPVWMKHNGKLGNGTQSENSAPAYTNNPTANTNQLRVDMYEEFAELCVAFVKIFKQEVGIDLYALSLQNEPRFSQFYQSAVYDGAALRDVIKVVGRRFKTENITTKLFAPEDVGWLDGATALVNPIINDAEARDYISFFATHGYAFDGIAAGSADAASWKTMYNWGAPYNKPLWMTETSGFENNHAGAMKMAKAMYTALHHGNISAWVFWTLSTGNLDAYSLMNSAGQKSKRYYVSKQFYRYVRPGAVRVDAAIAETAKLYPVAFKHDTNKEFSVVVINDNSSGKLVRLEGAGLPASFDLYITSEADNCRAAGKITNGSLFFIPPNAVVTLYSKE